MAKRVTDPWQADNDADILRRYNEIMTSPSRKKAAMNKLQSKANELNSAVKAFGGKIKRK